MRVLLDTVTFLWSVKEPERISKKAMAILAEPETEREISAVSLSEMAIKWAIGKLGISRSEVEQGVVDLELRVLPFNGVHAYKMFVLPMHHTDPFDRQIIAQAMVEEIPVVTSDRIFGAYQELQVIW
ncbi:MAG: type II toxin-antitoxin system VapC family toxin [Candidatus Acidiferrum sp.]